MEDVAIAVVFAVTGWMLRTYLTHRERMKELSMATRGLGASEQRLARVEHAVESIAVEVERIGEGQRYVTTLLNDRAHPALAAAVGAARPAEPLP
jgi:transposase